MVEALDYEDVSDVWPNCPADLAAAVQRLGIASLRDEIPPGQSSGVMTEPGSSYVVHASAPPVTSEVGAEAEHAAASAPDELAHMRRVLHAAVNQGVDLNTWMTNQNWVVLRAPRQDLNYPPDLFITSNDWIYLALTGKLGEVSSIALARNLVAEEGAAVLLRGLAPRLIKISLGQAVIFGVYDAALRWLRAR